MSAGGLLWYPGDSDADSLNPSLNAAMLLTRYAQIATTQEKAKSYLVSPSFPSCGPPHDTFPPELRPVPTRLRPRKQSHVRCAPNYRLPQMSCSPNCTFQHHTSWAPTQIHPRIPTRPWPAAGTTSATSTPPLRKKPTSFMARSSAGPIPRTGFTTSAATGQRQRYDSHIGRLPPSRALSS